MATSGVKMDGQAEYTERWLKLLPKPPARGPNRYDVFISYRSSDRRFAMALYDALRASGWQPFLDQFDLIPGSNLQTSLEENLEVSSAGVILWSSRTKDSEWCKRERQSMLRMRDGNPSFHFIYAKLDSEPLPLFAQADLYEDFGDSPEGPRGANLLRLICGMGGTKPDEQAVRFAQALNEATTSFLLKVKAAVTAGNVERLIELGASIDQAVYASGSLLTEVARSLISMGQPNDALTVLARALQNFPESVVAKQIKGLALRRTKRFQEAIDVLSELRAAGHQDPETLGILAAAFDGRYQETKKLLYLRQSRELYRTAFQADSKNYYTGINAATKSLFLGEPDESARIATLVEPIVTKPAPDDLFWSGCTLGEVYLLQRKLDSAAQQYQKMIDNYGQLAGDLHSTGDQATRICSALGLSQAETDKILAPFKLLDS
jgi:tetratricopeptide (TPR) repeat protein